jgi:hypothetical protein
MWLVSVAFAQSRPPRLLLTPDDFSRIESRTNTEPWAAAVRDGIVQGATTWATDHAARYGLTTWVMPPEGGQWTLWYVCPTHGVYLTAKGPGQNRCPVDDRNYTGWPYEQVIYMRRHSDNAASARDNALAYRFTGNLDYAKAAAKLLLAYADVYLKYPIKDTNNKINATSGGRVSAQTLDEAIWLIPMAWAYDLIADSGVLDASQKTHIEQDLLREAVRVISRNDAGVSNWQSWHNAAIGAVGYTLNDRTLITKAIDGTSGFRFQMRESVFDDGFWFEGAWGYHFFALDPLVQLAEMAARDNTDLFSAPALRKMFEAPINFALPDWTLPAFNDSGTANVLSYDRLYEVAYNRYKDPLLAVVLGTRSRGRDALFWGSDSLPDAVASTRGAEYFPASGNVVLHTRNSDHTVIFKFGPHGGWHGHYDKLNFVSFARGGMMAVDPGTQSYAAPTHTTWDKVTLAHNTVVVDEKTQNEATGSLQYFLNTPWVSAATADAGAAYKQASLQRTLVLTSNYLLDITTAKSLDGASHKFDWIYHNYGAASSDMAMQPYTALPKSEGYQHLTQVTATTTDNLWQANFDMSGAANAAYGSTYNSKTGIRSTFQYSRDVANSGDFSGKLTYDFSADQGYTLYTTPTLTGQPREMPLELSMWIYGDGSKHKLAIRMNDATDERFVYAVGPVDWTGWKLISASDPESWTHYLGNADGVFDLPVKNITIELTSVGGAPVQGAWYVDDITLRYPSGPLVISDFERLLRNLRVTMAGAANTTVVMGKGLGPDLLTPLPFVMARRTGKDAQFVALLEPYGDSGKVNSVQTLADGSILVEGLAESETFHDVVALGPGYCPVTVTRYFLESGRPGTSWRACSPGKLTPNR